MKIGIGMIFLAAFTTLFLLLACTGPSNQVSPISIETPLPSSTPRPAVTVAPIITATPTDVPVPLPDWMFAYYDEIEGYLGGPWRKEIIVQGMVPPRWQFSSDAERVQLLSFSPDGRQILFIQGDKIGQQLYVLSTFGNDGPRLLLRAPGPSSQGHARYLDNLQWISGSLELIVNIKTCLYPYPEKKQICNDGYDKFSTSALVVLDVESGETLRTIAFPGDAESAFRVIIAPDGRQALFINASTGEISLADTRSGTIQKAVLTYFPAYRYDFVNVVWATEMSAFLIVLPTPESKAEATQIGMYRLSLDHQAEELGRLAGVYSIENAPQAFLSPDGQWVAYNASQNLYLQNLASGAETKVGAINMYSSPYIWFSPDGSQLVYEGRPGLKWYDLNTQSQWKVTISPGRVQSWAPDSKSCIIYEFAQYEPAWAKIDQSAQDLYSSSSLYDIRWLDNHTILTLDDNHNYLYRFDLNAAGTRLSQDNANWLIYALWKPE